MVQDGKAVYAYDFATNEVWKQQKEKLPADLEDDEQVAIETGIANGLRARLFAEIEQATRTFALPSLTAGDEATRRAFVASIEKLEHSVGLLRLNLNVSAAPLSLFTSKGERTRTSLSTGSAAIEVEGAAAGWPAVGAGAAGAAGWAWPSRAARRLRSAAFSSCSRRRASESAVCPETEATVSIAARPIARVFLARSRWIRGVGFMLIGFVVSGSERG